MSSCNGLGEVGYANQTNRYLFNHSALNSSTFLSLLPCTSDVSFTNLDSCNSVGFRVQMLSSIQSVATSYDISFSDRYINQYLRVNLPPINTPYVTEKRAVRVSGGASTVYINDATSLPSPFGDAQFLNATSNPGDDFVRVEFTQPAWTSLAMSVHPADIQAGANLSATIQAELNTTRLVESCNASPPTLWVSPFSTCPPNSCDESAQCMFACMNSTTSPCAYDILEVCPNAFDPILTYTRYQDGIIDVFGTQISCPAKLTLLNSTFDSMSCSEDAVSFNVTSLSSNTAYSGSASLNVYMKPCDNFAIPSFNIYIDVLSVSQNVSSINGGDILTVTGTNFGDLEVGTASIMIGDRSCALLTRQPTMMTCEIPAGSGLNLNIDITVNLASFSYVYAFSYVPMLGEPLQTMPTAGGQITLFGASFGTDLEVVRINVTRLVSGSPVLLDGFSVQSVNGNSLVINTPTGTGAGYSLVFIVRVMNQLQLLQSNTILLHYTLPHISSMSIMTLDTVGGQITLIGTDFGNELDLLEVTLRAENRPDAPLTPTSVNRTHLIATYPNGTGAGYDLIVAVDTLQATRSINYSAPIILALNETTVLGKYFGSDLTRVSITVDYQTKRFAATALSVSDELIQVMFTSNVTFGGADDVIVTVSVDGQSDSVTIDGADDGDDDDGGSAFHHAYVASIVVAIALFI